MEFKVENKPKVAILLNGMIEITFTTQKSILSAIEGLKDETMLVSVKKYSKKRSLSQNSYLWILLEEIARQVNATKEEVYKNYIRDYGVWEILPIRNENVKNFVDKWSKNGIGWFCEDLGESKIDGYTKLIAYYGSSSYNSKEMSRVIDAVVSDCEEMGIETLTTAEIMSLKNENKE